MAPEERLEQAIQSVVGGGRGTIGGLSAHVSGSAPIFSAHRGQRSRPVFLVSFRRRLRSSRFSLRSQGRTRLFWSLITLGISFQLTYQLLWTYYEVILRRDVPDLFAGDVVLFLHIVPLMAALALRPHVPRDEYAARVGRLDFALLLIWWFYLYVLIVIPWQYVVADVPAYNRNLNAVYLAEKVAFLAGLVACWTASKGEWRKLSPACSA